MILNYSFKNTALLKAALTHPSVTKGVANYEKLEFLGDSIINMMITESLYTRFPDLNEGELSQFRSNLVKTDTLAAIALELEIDTLIILDKGEEKMGGRLNSHNLENTLEALIAAVYLDSNYETVRNIFSIYWEKYICNSTETLKKDPKTIVQEWSQAQKLGLPIYKLVNQMGPAHNVTFEVELNIQNHLKVLGKGSSIKKAQLDAAQQFIDLYI